MQRRFVWFAAAALSLAVPLIAAAQAPPQNIIQLTRYEQSGRVITGSDTTLVIDVGGQKHAVQLDARELGAPTIYEVKAKAYPTFLEKDLYVRFPAKLDAKGKRILEPIHQVTVFTPTADTRFGAFGEELNAPPGAAPLDRRAAASGQAFVVGRLTRVRKADFTVEVPTGKLEAKLAEDTTVDVNVSNKAGALQMLRPGDDVRVEGGTAPAGNIYATKVVATIARMLGEEPSKKLPRRVNPDDAGEAVASPVPATIGAGEGVGAVAPAAEEPPADAKPTRARILKVN